MEEGLFHDVTLSVPRASQTGVRTEVAFHTPTSTPTRFERPMVAHVRSDINQHPPCSTLVPRAGCWPGPVTYVISHACGIWGCPLLHLVSLAGTCPACPGPLLVAGDVSACTDTPQCPHFGVMPPGRPLTAFLWAWVWRVWVPLGEAKTRLRKTSREQELPEPQVREACGSLRATSRRPEASGFSRGRRGWQ